MQKLERKISEKWMLTNIIPFNTKLLRYFIQNTYYLTLSFIYLKLVLFYKLKFQYFCVFFGNTLNLRANGAK